MKKKLLAPVYGKGYQRLRIEYNCKEPDNDIDTLIAGLVEYPPLNFKWTGQGYDFLTNTRDICFVRKIKKGVK